MYAHTVHPIMFTKGTVTVNVLQMAFIIRLHIFSSTCTNIIWKHSYALHTYDDKSQC